MKVRINLLEAALIVIAFCLIKLVFFSEKTHNCEFVPSAYAEGSILEWEGSNRIVTSGEEGATTYVWDYDAKTEVRKYFIEDGKLKMQVYKMDKKK